MLYTTVHFTANMSGLYLGYLLQFIWRVQKNIVEHFCESHHCKNLNLKNLVSAN